MIEHNNTIDILKLLEAWTLNKFLLEFVYGVDNIFLLN